MFPLKLLPSPQDRADLVSRTYIPYVQTKILTLPLENHYVNFWYVNPVCLILKRYYTWIWFIFMIYSNEKSLSVYSNSLLLIPTKTNNFSIIYHFNTDLVNHKIEFRDDKNLQNIFFLLAGHKVHFVAPCGANKSILLPPSRKKSCAIWKKHLFYSCDCCPRFALASNFTLIK